MIKSRRDEAAPPLDSQVLKELEALMRLPATERQEILTRPAKPSATSLQPLPVSSSRPQSFGKGKIIRGKTVKPPQHLESLSLEEMAEKINNNPLLRQIVLQVATGKRGR